MSGRGLPQPHPPCLGRLLRHSARGVGSLGLLGNEEGEERVGLTIAVRGHELLIVLGEHDSPDPFGSAQWIDIYVRALKGDQARVYLKAF